MALRRIPIHRAGNRENLFMGGERELVMLVGLIAAVLVAVMHSLLAATFGVALWFFALFIFRLMAKNDPKLSRVYIRHVLWYRKYYPARSTPFWKSVPFGKPTAGNK